MTSWPPHSAGIPNIHTAIGVMAEALAAVSDSPRLEAELLIATVLQRPRAWIVAHGEQSLTGEQLQRLSDLSERRIDHEPIAYITGYREFWGLNLAVSPDVLVPRPETEDMIEWVLANFPASLPLTVGDLGTGSGAIALALGVERPLWRIDATDQFPTALQIAQRNAAHYPSAHINFYLGDWCCALPNKNYALLISNPPYIAADDPHLHALKHEPQHALASGGDGLDAIRTIIAQSPEYLAESGYLILEHGYDQADQVIQLLKQNGFTHIQSHRDLAHQPRFISARNSR